MTKQTKLGPDQARVVLAHGLDVDDTTHPPGAEVTLDEDRARGLVGAGWARPADAASAAVIGPQPGDPLVDPTIDQG